MTMNGNIITIEVFELKSLISDAVEIGIHRYEQEKVSNPYMSKREAYAKYGRENVDRWIREGLIRQEKDGDKNHKIRINRMQIKAAAAASNRVSFYKNRNAED